MEYDLSKEIGIKCLNGIERVYQDYLQKRISDEAYSYASKLLWHAFSGLVGNDLTEMLTYLPEPPANAPKGLKTVLVKDATIALVTTDLDGIVEIRMIDALTGDERSKIDNFNNKDCTSPTIEAHQKYSAIIEQLTRKNFRKIG